MIPTFRQRHLELFKNAWNDSSLFANAGNLDPD